MPSLLKSYLVHSLNLSLEVQRPDFFAGTLQEAKRPGRGGSGSDGHHQALGLGEFDSSVKSDFTVARPSSLFWRGTVKAFWAQ